MAIIDRNALDAAVAAYQGVSALRQQLPSTDRVHGENIQSIVIVKEEFQLSREVANSASHNAE